MTVSFSKDLRIILVGGGKMGGALLQGWLNQGLPADHICVVDPILPEDAYPATIVKDAVSIPATFHATMIVLAVKPQLAADIVPDYQDHIHNDTAVLSIMAGQRLQTLEQYVGDTTPVIRAMPNLPAQISQGATVMVANSHVNDSQKSLCTQLLETVGKAFWVDNESLMDAVTALSGSGPAYIFHFIECLVDAGIELGLPRDLALHLAYQTVTGSVALASDSTVSATEWRERVTSPNGTTQAALDVLMAKESCNLRQLILDALNAAAIRSRELST